MVIYLMIIQRYSSSGVNHPQLDTNNEAVFLAVAFHWNELELNCWSFVWVNKTLSGMNKSRVRLAGYLHMWTVNVSIHMRWAVLSYADVIVIHSSAGTYANLRHCITITFMIYGYMLVRLNFNDPFPFVCRFEESFLIRTTA